MQAKGEFDDNAGVRAFLTGFGEATVNQALDVLRRNCERPIDREEAEKEDDQKYMLNVAIVNFCSSINLITSLEISLSKIE